MKQIVLLILILLLLIYSPHLLAGVTQNGANVNLTHGGAKGDTGPAGASDWSQITNKPAIPPLTTNTGVLLMSSTGCAAGWQSGALASEIATWVAAGVPATHIKCWDNSGAVSNLIVIADMTLALGIESPTVVAVGGSSILVSDMTLATLMENPTIALAGAILVSDMTLATLMENPTIQVGGLAFEDLFNNSSIDAKFTVTTANTGTITETTELSTSWTTGTAAAAMRYTDFSTTLTTGTYRFKLKNTTGVADNTGHLLTVFQSATPLAADVIGNLSPKFRLACVVIPGGPLGHQVLLAAMDSTDVYDVVAGTTPVDMNDSSDYEMVISVDATGSPKKLKAQVRSSADAVLADTGWLNLGSAVKDSSENWYLGVVADYFTDTHTLKIKGHRFQHLSTHL